MTAGQLATHRGDYDLPTLDRAARRVGALMAAERAVVTACNVAVLDLEGRVGRYGEARHQVARALGNSAEGDVLGCAGMADLAAALSQKFAVPIVDGVAAAVKQAEALVGLKLTTSRRGSYARPAVKEYAGMLASFAPKASG